VKHARILVAPNAFKGSLTAREAAAAMARGVRRARPGAEVVLMPIADGGDGLIDVLRGAEGGALLSVSVHGPNGEKRRSSYLWLHNRRTAVIEMARASGLALVPERRRRPLSATSRGTGELIKDAVRRGARTIVVGMGGAACNDGGAGMARALGARLLDVAGRELPDGAEPLLRLARVEDAAARALLAGVNVIALSDVTNPLLGPRGSAPVYGPQKGATPAQVKVLERALGRYAAVIAKDLRIKVGSVPGAGAAGGLGAGLLAFARAELVPGADWVLQRIGARHHLGMATLIITGEGRLDRTTLAGKAPAALARLARGPVVAVAGQAEKGVRGPFRSVVTFADAGAKTNADALRRASFWAARAAALAAACVCLLLAAPARAHDGDVEEARRVDALYFDRNTGDKLAESIRLLDADIERVSKEPASSGLQAMYRLMRCRSLVRRGEKREKKADKLADYDAAKKDCEASVALSSGAADAHFWYGVTMGRWGEAKGIMKALFLVKPIKREMEATLRLDPSHGGAHRVRGEILWQLPGFAGGDKKQALKEFEEAVRLSPDHTSNYQPLAEAYAYFKRKDDAVRTLKAVEAVAKPADPAEYPDDLKDARALLEKLGGR
jgi:glycerate kinase